MIAPMAQKILIVDDDPAVIEYLKTLLGLQGYEIILAADGVQAMEKAMKVKPDLIILDIMMPGGSGVTVYNRLKQSTLTQKIPIMFLTAMPQDQAREKMPPPQDQVLILSKPVDQDGFLTTVKAQLKPPA